MFQINLLKNISYNEQFCASIDINWIILDTMFTLFVLNHESTPKLKTWNYAAYKQYFDKSWVFLLHGGCKNGHPKDDLFSFCYISYRHSPLHGAFFMVVQFVLQPHWFIWATGLNKTVMSCFSSFFPPVIFYKYLNVRKLWNRPVLVHTKILKR